MPFFVRNIDSGKCIKIVGIRKDNRLIYEEGENKAQLSEYDEKNYIEYDEEHEKDYAKVALFQLEINKLKDKIYNVRKNITGYDLKALKSQYLLPV